MSLIPSESYTFPDHFTTTVTPSRKPTEKKPPVELKVVAPAEEIISRNEEPAEIQKRQRRSLSSLLKRAGRRHEVASLPEPEPAPEEIAPRAPTPKPVLRVETMRPPQPSQVAPVSMKPVPVRNVIPMQVAPAPPQIAVARAPIVRPQPQPQPAPTTPPKMARPLAAPAPPTRAHTLDLSHQPDFFEMFAQNNDQTLLKRRRKMKMRRFIAYESIAVGVLLPLAFVGLTRQVTMPVLVWIVDILTIAAAVAAAVIPIAFFALTPTLPEIER
jgi:hypothetical protein